MLGSMKERNLQLFAWGLSAVAAIIAVVAWGQSVRWQVSDIDSYRLFPLFGLVAFSLMWTHYIASVARQHFNIDKKALHRYFETTSLVVLAAILAHPGLLAWQLWRDGLGLPPASELNFVSTNMRLYIIFAFTALLIFLAYEFRRWYQDRAWWQYIEKATDVAMVLVFLHSLHLGSQLQSGWLVPIWYFYGVTLGLSLVYIYYQKFKPRQIARQ